MFMGKTCTLATVHPHASGEHLVISKKLNMPTGSSPREWGTRGGAIAGAEELRFIPTRVGNTLSLLLLSF